MGDPSATKPAPAANGTLAKTPFVHLLLYALERKLGGTIELFASDKRSGVVLFAQGEPAKVRTSEPVAHLGRVLLEMGHLTEEQLNGSLAELARAKATGRKLHGELLVAQGVIDGAKLRAGLTQQIVRKLHHVAAMPDDTVYAYYEGYDGLRGWGSDETRGVDPLPALWGMLREYPPWEHVNAALARVAASPLRLARGTDLAPLGLAKEEAAALQLLLTRPMRAGELAKAGQLNERTAQLLVYLLLVTKKVDVLPAGEMPRTSVRPSPLPAPAPSPAARVTSSIPPQATTRTSSNPAGRPARTSSKSLAPLAPPPSLSPELAERWKEIVDRAQTIDRADYFMMLDLARDATRDEVESAFLALAKRWHPDRLPAELGPVRDACSRVFGRMNEAHNTLADAEHRARYMKLLADGSGSPEMQETVAKVVEAAQNFQKAEVCFKRNDLGQAETFCRLALESDPTQADYHAMIAWLTALKPDHLSPEKTMVTIKMLERAIAMNQHCEKAFFYRGMLYKRLGKIDLATKDFKRVAELNPRNIDAAREVRLSNMRGGSRGSAPPARPRASPTPPKHDKKDEGTKPGLFGRLFKRP